MCPSRRGIRTGRVRGHRWAGDIHTGTHVTNERVKKPILAISLELYDDATQYGQNATVIRKQWFDETHGTFGALVRGRRVLIVDEVDDTRLDVAICR